MKLLVTSDWHLDAITAGIERGPEIMRAVEQTTAAARDEGVHVYLMLGDLCDPDAARAPRCGAYAIRVASDLAAAGIVSRWLVGNHDVIEDGSGSSVLSPLAAAAERLPLSTPEGRDNLGAPAVAVYERPTHEYIGGVGVLALPFVPRVHAYDPEAVLDDFADRDVDVVIGHLNVPGVVPASESDEMARGRQVWLPVEEIRRRWPGALVLNGHYHRQQVADGVAIPGALARLTFGEAAHEPAFLVVEV